MIPPAGGEHGTRSDMIWYQIDTLVPFELIHAVGAIWIASDAWIGWDGPVKRIYNLVQFGPHTTNVSGSRNSSIVDRIAFALIVVAARCKIYSTPPPPVIKKLKILQVRLHFNRLRDIAIEDGNRQDDRYRTYVKTGRYRKIASAEEWTSSP